MDVLYSATLRKKAVEMKKTTIRLIVALWVTVFLALGSPFYAFAQDVGRITYVEGRVDVLKPGTEMSVPTRSEEVISLGDVIRTKSNSKAEITFKDKSILRLAENSRVKIEDYQLDQENKRQTATINLERGKVRAIVEKMAVSADFKIYTPNAQGTIKGSDIFAFYEAGNSGMLVAAGNLYVVNPMVPIPPMIIPPGNSVLVPLDQAPKGPRPYLEMEKTFYEKDTNPPPTISARQDATRIEAAVTKVSGDVKIILEGNKEPMAASVNQIVRMGDVIETGNDGMIELKFDNGNALNLQPNTRITMTKMVIDPKTGKFESLLDVSLGKVRARIENIQGGSSFEIKTPQAISGVRGTLMYLIITSAFTKAFFEGGPGFIQNLVSGVTKEVPMGQSASADDQGSVSDPAPVSGDERMEFTEGWVPGSGVEGYSSPDNVTGGYLYEGDTNVNNVGQAGGGGGEGAPAGDTAAAGTNNSTAEIPVTETAGLSGLGGATSGSSTGDTGSGSISEETPSDSNSPGGDIVPPSDENPPPGPGENPPPGSGENPPPGPGENPPPGPDENPPEEPSASLGDLSASFGQFNNILSQPEFGFGSISGEVRSSDLAFSNDSKNFRISGTFSPPQAPNENFDQLWQGEVSGAFDDGSIYSGVVGGTHINNALEGRLFAFYIRPDGNDGFLSGYLRSSDLAGNFDPGTGTFEAQGSITAFLDFPTSHVPNDLLDEAIEENSTAQGFFSGDFGIGGRLEFDSAQIEDQNWGLFFGSSGGFFNNVPDSSWEVPLTGFSGDIFGFSDIFVYGSVTGNAWQNNELSGSLSGWFLSVENFGTFGGDLLGTYDEATHQWQGLSAGTYEDTLSLESSGNLFFMISRFGFFDTAWMYGLTGLGRTSEDPIWLNREVAFVSIGNFLNTFTNVNNQPFIWHTGLVYAGFGHFFNQTFPDNNGDVGALYGVAGGIGTNRILSGKAYGLYVDPQGNAGIFSGPLNGTYVDNGSGLRVADCCEVTGGYLFGATNLFSLDDPKTDGIDPQGLAGLVRSNDLIGGDLFGVTASGTFDAGGTIQQNEIFGSFYNLEQEPWGIYNLYTDGTYEGPVSDHWQTSNMTGLVFDFTNFFIGGGAWLGSIEGTTWKFDETTFNDNILQGNLNAIWIQLMEDGKLAGRSMTGEVIGNYTDVEEGSLWQATSTGEWVEVDDNLTTADEVIALGTAAEIPITEVYTSLLNGAGAFNAGGTITPETFFIDFFAMNPNAAQGIWAAHISGNFTGPTGDEFTINAEGNLRDSANNNVIGTVNTTLIGTEWSAGQWQAFVGGSTDTGINLSGVAGGTFDNPTPGTFSGAGTGVWGAQ